MIINVYHKLVEICQNQPQFDLKVNTIREAVHVLMANFKGLQDYLLEAEAEGIGFEVYSKSGEYFTQEMLDTYADEVHIVPVPIASGGVGRALLGVALIGASFFIPAAGLFGLSALGAGQVATLGTALLLGGVAQLFAPNPRNDSGQDIATAENYSIGGRVQSDREGNPVPVLIGERYIENLTIISASLSTVDLEVVGETT